MYKAIKYILLISLSFPLFTIAQNLQLKFENITVADGLSHNNIYSIIQDNEGYIWIGTQDGLNMYDGYKFTIYRHEPSNPNSISSNNFGKIYQDSDGYIWLGTYGGGLDKFDPLSLTFKHYKYDEHNNNSISSDRIQFMHEDKYGLFWIGTTGDNGGLNMFDKESEQFVRFLHDEENEKSLSHYRAKTIAEDKEGNLWIGTGKGLNLLDRKTGGFKKYMHDPKNNKSISNNHIQSILVDHTGIIWLGGRGGGLNKFNSETEEFIHFKHNPKDPTSLSDNNVEFIFEDSEYNLWVGTYSGGLNLFNPDNETFKSYVFDPVNPFSIAHNRIEYIFEDRTKVLWIGTRGGGISKLDLKSKKFYNIIYNTQQKGILPHPSVFAISADTLGNLWFGTDGNGMVKYNKNTKKVIHFSKNKNANYRISSNRIWTILVDSRGIIWAGTYDGGINRIIEKPNGKYQIDMIKPSRDNASSIAGKQVNIIYEDQSGRIWLGTKRGLNLLQSDPYDREFNFKHFTHDINDLSTLSDNYISTICEDSYGSLWIGTYISGLNQMDIETGKITRYYYDTNDSTTISNNRVQTIYEDKNKNLWIGTEGAGLNKFDRKNQQFDRIKQNSEALSNVIMGIVEDGNGNLWISTSGGITKFNIQKELFERKYDITDGLISHGFNRNACYRSNTGKIYFGNISGVTFFKPMEVEDNPFVPSILFTDFKILNQRLKSIDSSRYRKFRKEKIVDLNYSENVFHIEFAASDYSSVSKNRFKYMLQGFEKEWQTADNQRMVTYTNLYPGQYTFIVIGSNNDGVWNNKGASLKIKVHPPFYLTRGFIITSILFFIALIYLIIQLRLRKLDRDKRKLEIKVNERTHEINKQKEELKRANQEIKESARLKEMFLANTSHEIRTPLNVIVGFTNLLINSDIDQKQHAYLNNIKNSSNNLLVLINDILDFSKIEADKLILEEIRFDIRNTIKTILNPLTIKADEKNLSLNYEIEPEVPNFLIGDPVRLNQILVNLIGNSIKFTGKDGTIQLDICLIETENKFAHLSFSVSDTGIGIHPDKTEKIFESFSQGRSDTSRKYGGTGLGLTIVKRLVELHNGDITVKSELGKGSKFTVNLSYKLGEKESVKLSTGKIRSKDSKIIDDLKILIVEDNKANQTLAVDTIYMFNNKILIEVADNGKIALNKMKENDFDLIIMDVQMPEMNGYDTTDYIRNKITGEKSKTPILGMSAHAMNNEKERCIALGMNDYITKPFNPNVLFSKILKLTGFSKEKTNEEESFIPEILLVKNRYKSINLVFLTKTYKGNFEKVKSILKVYLTNLPGQIEEFSDNFKEKDLKKIKASAHSLKTSFKYLGVDHLNKLFKTIELEATDGGISEDSKSKIIKLNDDWSKSQSEINDFINSDI